MKNVVVFDLDDTLYKEVDYVRSGFAAVASHLGDDELSGVMFKAWSAGNNPFDAIDALIPGVDIASLVAVYRNHMPSITLPAETESTLVALHGTCHLALITDGRSVGQRNKIEALGLARFFAPGDILISGETGFDKHSPKNFLAVASHYPQALRFFYIGDNPAKDFYHPNALGWHTIMLKDVSGVNIHRQEGEWNDEHRAHYVVDSLGDIVAIIEKSL